MWRLREEWREKKRLGRRKEEMRDGWDFIEAVATVCVLLKKVSGAGAEKKHAEDASRERRGRENASEGDEEGASDAGRAVATPGVRWSRLKRSDAARAQQLPSSPSSSLLLPLLPLSPSPFLRGANTLSVSPCLFLYTRHFFLFLFPCVPGRGGGEGSAFVSLILTNCTASFLDFHRFPRLILPFLAISRSHGSPPSPSPPSSRSPPISTLVSSRSALAFLNRGGEYRVSS